MRLTVSLEGVGVLGPGMPDWPATAAVLAGRVPYARTRTVLPLPELLPAAERRRAGRVIRLALAAGMEAVRHSGREAASLASVFTSSGGDGDNCHALCEALADPQRMISPTRFHNSVHNAAAGYWSIACGCTEASTTLCAYDASLTAGLMEAAVQVNQYGRPVLLVAYDADYPPPLQAFRSIEDAFGVGLVLAPPGTAASRAQLTVSLSFAPADRLGNSQIESLRASSPAARGLPLLESLALGRNGCVHLDYLDGRSMAVEVHA
jgi:hypothetical protein